MHKKLLYILFCWLFSCSSFSQIAPNTWWVEFTDKEKNGYSIDHPEKFLSDRAISRREKQDIAVTYADLPVSVTYIDSLKSLGLQIHNTSKWLNGASIVSTDTALLDTLHKYSFIANEINTNIVGSCLKSTGNKLNTEPATTEYGDSERQITMLNGDKLHTNGYEGQDIMIAIQDAGFDNTLEVESLQHVWADNRVIAWRDFVNDGKAFFSSHKHGTTVFSIIAGIVDGQMYGTATKADFVLVRTEKGDYENILEEYDWVCGVEYCDSIGVDIINSSLGYSQFDNPNQNHSFSDLDGKTTPISLGALFAARTGMLVVTSAGNEGNDPWLHITAPADADSILSVGAVNSTEIIAGFSGRGHSYDGRIKPEVSAQGVETVSQSRAGIITTCNGTSCSSPIVAGMAACLWQSRPNASAQYIRQAIIQASNRYAWPDSLYGYGIPDFFAAQSILDSILPKENSLSTIELTPNLIDDYAQLSTTLPWLSETTEGIVAIYDINGRLVKSSTVMFNPGITISPIEMVLSLDNGYYVVRIAVAGRFYNIPFIKT